MRFSKRGVKRLSAALAFSVVGGLNASITYASDDYKEYHQGLNGIVDDNNWITVNNDNASVKNLDGVVTYDLKGADYEFGDSTKGRAAYFSGATTVNLDQDKTLYLMNYGSAIGKYEYASMIVNSKSGANSNVTINGNVFAFAESDSYNCAGILYSIGSGVGEKSTLTINGDLTMGSGDEEDTWDRGIKSKDVHGNYKNYKGVRWAPAGVFLNSGEGSEFTVNGKTDLRVYANAIITDPYYKSGTLSDKELVLVNLNGDTHIEVRPNDSIGFYALGSFGGTINVNMKDGAPSTNTVTIDGNIISMGNADTRGGSSFFRDGEINLALTNADSKWKGVVDNTGADEAGTVNLYLQNGAQWTHNCYAADGVYAGGTIVSPSKDYYGPYDHISHVTSLSGGSSPETAGNIFQQNAADINIENYSGNTNVFYAHDGYTPTTFSAGNIVIGKAAAGSAINLITDNTGIKMDDDTAVNSVLNALANKLYYTAYTKGENNLTGKVKIAEGLTSSSTERKVGNVAFSSTNGKGTFEGYEAPPPSKKDQVITGDITVDTAYADVYADGAYTFTGESTEIAGVDAKQDLKIATSDGYGAIMINRQTASGDAIGVSNTSNSTINLTKGRSTCANLTITAIADDGNAYGIYIKGTDENKQAKLNWDYDGGTDWGVVSLNAIGKNSSIGVYAAGNAKIDVYPDFGIYDDNYDFIGYGLAENDNGLINSTALYATKDDVLKKGAEINAYNPLIRVNGNGAFANGGNSKINLSVSSGFKIEVNKDNTKGYVALGASGGTVDVNERKNISYTIKGNVMVSSLAADGIDEATEAEINLHLQKGKKGKTKEWTGVAYNAFSDDGLKVNDKTYNGAINLWLDNFSIWNNEPWGITAKAGSNDLDFSGSHIANLTSGASASEAGHIFQRDTNPLTIDKLSGMVKIYYAHEEATPTIFNTGNTIVKSAETSSAVIMITDQSGITLDDDAAVNAVLNALANKLYYTGYASGERNLRGEVQIAEGLTSSSATKKFGTIAFSDDGKGSLEGYTPTPPSPGQQTVFVYSTGIKNSGLDDTAYVNGGVRQSDGTYKMTGDTTIALKDVSSANTAIINSNGNDLTIDAGANELKTSIDGTALVYGILKQDKAKTEITASKLIVDVTSTGRTEAINVLNADDGVNKAIVTINADTYLTANAGSGAAMGIHSVGNSEVNINGNLTIKGDGTTAKPWGVSLTNGGYSYFGGAALYSHSTMSEPLQQAGDINVSGKVDIESAVNGAYVNGGGGHINLAGGSIKIDKDNNRGYAALRAESGYINMNMNADGTAAANKVNILGNVNVTCGAVNEQLEPNLESVVNLGMATNDSTWTGVAYNAFPDEGLGRVKIATGAINLWLQNGATWTNEHYGMTETAYAGNDFAGSHLAKLVGGSSASNAGYIFQNDSNPLTIDNYSGNTKVFYAHDAATPTTFVAGDITIRKAAAGSKITLATNNTGINVAANSEINPVLNALAEKLTYVAYTTGERNLTGAVEIMEGLTASSVTLQTGAISFDAETGKGTLVDGSVTPGGTIDDIKTAEITADTNYTNNTAVVVDTKDTSVGAVVAAKGDNTATNINAAGKTITLEAQGGSEKAATVYANGTDGAVNVAAKNVAINAAGADGSTAITAKDGGAVKVEAETLNVSGAVTNNGGTVDLTKSGNITINGNVTNEAGTMSIGGEGKTTVINGNVVNKSTDAADLTIVLDGKNSEINGLIDPVNLTLNNEAKWNNVGEEFASDIGTLTSNKGYINQKSTQGINIATLSGDVTVNYDSTYAGGVLTIDNTQGKVTLNAVDTTKNNVITINTNNNDIPAAGLNDYETPLTALAKKLNYTGSVTDGKADKLDAYAKINEGLTRSGATAPILFTDADGDNNIIGTIERSSIEYGAYETQLMKGSRAAMTSSAMAWRAEANDLMRRMGDLRLSPEQLGAWARIYRGKNSSDKDGANYNLNYTTVQAGYDWQAGKNWRLGTAFSYMEGRSGYDMGNGENKEYNLGFYGTWNDDKGQYVDLIAKIGRLTNDYKIYNDMGYRVDGDYGNLGLSLSAEYGKKFRQASGFYFEPSAELNFTHLNGADYTAHSTYSFGDMRVSQSSFNSFIGRIAVGFGYEQPNSTIYAKLSLNHEFCGGMTSSFAAEEFKDIHQNFRDTWVGLQIGGTAKLSDNCNFYGNIERTFGGDIKTDYRIDAGFRFAF